MLNLAKKSLVLCFFVLKNNKTNENSSSNSSGFAEHEKDIYRKRKARTRSLLSSFPFSVQNVGISDRSGRAVERDENRRTTFVVQLPIVEFIFLPALRLSLRSSSRRDVHLPSGDHVVGQRLEFHSATSFHSVFVRRIVEIRRAAVVEHALVSRELLDDPGHRRLFRALLLVRSANRLPLFHRFAAEVEGKRQSSGFGLSNRCFALLRQSRNRLLSRQCQATLSTLRQFILDRLHHLLRTERSAQLFDRALRSGAIGSDVGSAR